MICAAFIFEPGEYDDEFNRLDNAIEIYARALPGFIRVERWKSRDNNYLNSMYYFSDLNTLEKLANLPAHLKAKEGVDRWYKDYKIEIFELKESYGKSDKEKNV